MENETLTGVGGFSCLVQAPYGLDQTACLRAAEKCGATGLGQFAPDIGREAFGEELARIAAAGIGRFGLYIGTKDNLALLRGGVPDAVSHVIAPASVLRGAGDVLRSLGDHVTVLAEVTRWRPGLARISARVSGFVLKGHECAGLVSEQTSFVLLQQFRRKTDRPLFVRGGITPATAAASSVAGAAGVVLDDQIMLLPEARLPDGPLRRRIEAFSGNETVQVEDPRGGAYLRGFARHPRDAERDLTRQIEDDPDAAARVAQGFSWAGAEIAPGGQGLALAVAMRRRYGTLGRLVTAIRAAVTALPAEAAARGALAEHGELARALGTRYPVLQGPMTRVSDVSDFFVRVAEGGGLPFAALALLRGETAETLLARTEAQMGDRPWGVGLLGFAGKKVLEPQLQAIDRHKPRYAIVAGARVNQLRALEDKGIAAFAHVSTASMLGHYLDEGIRRFVIEGRECGGHIGPMSSFVLWSAIVDELLRHPAIRKSPGAVQLVFAGGIHDDVSAAMVAALAEPAAARGVAIGVLMGTAYLFTPEIVESGAIVPDYQQVALACDETQSFWEGPGFASRCAVTPIAGDFRARRRELAAAGATVPEIREALEEYSLGRLRMATKGLARTGPDKALTEIGEDRRRREGMYMIGQVAAQHDRLQSIPALHESVTAGACRFLEAHHAPAPAAARPAAAPPPCDIAIVGMATLLPGSDTLEGYWRRILTGASAIREIPRDRWSLTGYFSDDPAERDRICSMRGGFLPDIAFNPLDYGIPPASIPSIDPMQLLALELVSDALKDAAGPGEDSFDKERMSVMLGFSGGLGETGTQYATRSELRRLLGEVPDEVLARLPEWTEDSFAGLLPNVAAGRVADRFDLGGTNQTVDAACASSLAALYNAVQELESGRADAVIAGGVDTLQSPFGYLCFANTRALSPRGVCNTFDAAADGIVISEGLAAVVLKRLADAERDGDRIYAVVKGVGASSNGRARGLTAPLPKGQTRALRRAYAQAGFAPSEVQLLEAHGTGTVAGDKAELETVCGILEGSGIAPRSVAIGSAKTLIGHTKATAGIAGLIKVALGLHQRVLPPHALVTVPNAVFDGDETPLYLSQAPRPWTVPEDTPRRAGVSAFGFGGTNFHIALEEYQDAAQPAPQADCGADLVPFAIAAPTREALTEALRGLEARAAEAPGAGLVALARDAFAPAGEHRLAFVATGRAHLAEMVAGGLAYLTGRTKHPPEGMVCRAEPALLRGGKLAFLFSGQGAQYPDMLRQTALLGPALTDSLDRAGRVLAETPTFRRLGRPLARLIYPGDAFTPAQRKAQMAALTATEVAQPALGAVETGLARLLAGLGVAPDMAAGHSYGEFAALCAAGALDCDALIRLSEARGRAMVDNADPEVPGAMIAVAADAAQTRAAVGELDGVVLANNNSPRQTVIAGAKAAMDRAADALKAAGLSATPVPVSQAFHSPLMAPARAQFAQALEAVAWHPPAFPVYSNVTAEPHDPARIAAVMAEHLTSPVDFVTEIRNMMRDGARVFVEIGPKAILSGRVGEIAAPGAARAVALDGGNGEATAFMHGLAELFAEGAPVDFAVLLDGMSAPTARATGAEGAHRWLLNGAYARRADAPRRDVEPPAQSVLPQAAADPAQPAIQSSDPDEELEFMELKPPPGFPPPGAGGGQDDILDSYHRMMTEFLRVQESVMRAYLGTGGTARTGVAPAAPRAVTPMLQPAPAAPEFALPDPVPAPQAAPADAAQAAEPEAPAAPEPAAAASREDVLASFIRIVSDKTGYPADTLDPDQALEADLGVDSIKRMEILGTVQKTLPDPLANAMRGDMDTIAQLPTMREIVDYVFDNGGPGEPEAAPEAEGADPFEKTGEAEPAAIAVLPRFVQRPFAESADHVPPDLPDNALAVVTASNDGFHEAVAEALRGKGVEMTILPRALMAQGAEALPQWFADLGLKDRPLALVHSAGRAVLSDDVFAAPQAWHDAHAAGTKAAFHLLQAAQPWLQQGGRFVAVMETGGYFGRAPDGAGAPLAAEAGVVGLVKSLSLEWPDCSLKAVDLDPEQTQAQQAGQVVAELTMRPGRREAGYPAGRRVIFRTEAAATEPPRAPDIEIGRGWVVLASGGARGITAECLRSLAPSGARLVLLGRSPRPDPEPEALRDLDEAGLRAHFLAAARAEGGKPRPAEIEARLRRHLALRDMDRNLRDFAQMGARVDYRQVDVCDPEAVQALCAELTERYGGIDMLVHGAGLIEDTQIEKKSRESFDRVFDTKVDSALTLVEAARGARLKIVAFFASVAGRYGNPGQCDYAAANETLNSYARALPRHLPAGCRVKTINWGPWAATTTGAGMVTDSVRSQFLARGIGMVDPVPGGEFFYREMFWSDPDEVESVAWVADGETMEATACALPPDPSVRPVPGEPLLLRGARLVPDQPQRLAWRFDMVSAPYTDDHRFDGHPVMPFAAVMQIMSEIPAAFGFDRPVIALSDMQMLSGLSLKDGDLDLAVEMQPGADDGTYEVRILSDGPKQRCHYKAGLILGDTVPQSDRRAGPTGGIAPWTGPSIRDIYRSWLSHGPRFQAIGEIAALDERHVRSRVVPTPPQCFVPWARDRDWAFDPGLIDSMLQALWVWTRSLHDRSGLPLAARSVRRFAGDSQSGPLWVETDSITLSDSDVLTADVRAFDAAGRLCYAIEGFRVQCSRTLNRLGGGWPGGTREEAGRMSRKVAE